MKIILCLLTVILISVSCKEKFAEDLSFISENKHLKLDLKMSLENNQGSEIIVDSTILNQYDLFSQHEKNFFLSILVSVRNNDVNPGMHPYNLYQHTISLSDTLAELSEYNLDFAPYMTTEYYITGSVPNYMDDSHTDLQSNINFNSAPSLLSIVPTIYTAFLNRSSNHDNFIFYIVKHVDLITSEISYSVFLGDETYYSEGDQPEIPPF
ncbi:hypothetical protein FAZ19_13155 [Sphingobacterium alkalisoli]|uniref:Uncharacterized protein n=1 Tax=Sphingobacterium alkalisoli TaxID=1874115 RepID=A0A4U0H317_9SPHI|nr:hypothetical protein [Sphingobacterium alkalisoli]TJY66035.1 hypothetical protein FAZ19_13155 [Sphingobacterium alkalisoli]GGH16654.1 hypothetical protein GCM10011418_19160 [Sphingobacterium alkalisoli]